MKSKEERIDEAYKEYEKIVSPALKKYKEKANKINAEPETKCPTCGK